VSELGPELLTATLTINEEAAEIDTRLAVQAMDAALRELEAYTAPPAV